MLAGEAETVIDSIQAEDDEWSSMKIRINNDDLQGNIHVKDKSEEEAPEDKGDGELDTESDFVYYFNIIL